MDRWCSSGSARRTRPGAVGTTYHVERAVGNPDGPMAYVGTTGEKKFIDQTIPAGTSMIFYQVRGVRSTKVGPTATHFVKLGGGGRLLGGYAMKPKVARIAA